jgi:nitrous oxidase accessory protein
MNRLLAPPEKSWLIASVIACGLLLGALFVPLWRMELVAPQYPAGLVMRAYGYKFVGDPNTYYDDVREINGLNHYIGMKPIVKVTEMSIFIPGVLALAIATLLVPFVSWKRRWLRALITLGFWVMPLFFVVDLQYWLYHYGHTMNPEAPLNTGSFTPKVMGATRVWNFHSQTGFEIGFYLMLAAALVITLVPLLPLLARRLRRGREAEHPSRGDTARPAAGRGHIAAIILLLAGLLGVAAMLASAPPARAQDAGLSLQQRIDRAAPEDIVIVDGGVFREPVVINKSISLIGRNSPVIDGGGQGDVVTISADDVVISGFTIRGSSKNMSQEPAAIKVKDAQRVTIRANHLEDAHFGVHITNSADDLIDSNVIDVGGDTPIARRGHGIYLWEVTGSTIYANTIRHAADGIHMEYADRNGIGKNTVTDSRYALHFMYANDDKVIGNTFRGNLAGAVLMYSKDLIMKDNELSDNRRGASGTGILLKDDDNVWIEGNRIMRNKFGVTVDGSPAAAGATAIFRRNTFALNDTGIGLLPNAPITFIENAMIDNTVQVKALSGELATALSSHSGAVPVDGAPPAGGTPALSKAAVWTSAGRGNYWSDYRGFDANGDGVGDQPYLPRPPFAGRLGNEEMLRLFQFTPAQQAIDAATDMFPVYKYNAVIEDGSPLMEPPPGLALSRDAGINIRLLGVSVLLVLLSAFVAGRFASVDAARLLRRMLGARKRGGRPGEAPV